METRLAALRSILASRHVDGFIVPRTDEFQGEYVAANAERLAWLTGFTGSAGQAVVLPGQVWLFVDGRYTIQAVNEVAGLPIQVRHLAQKPMMDVLAAEVPAGTRLGYDPWLHTPDQVAQLTAACTLAQAHLVAVAGNPVDEAWRDRPAPPQAPLRLHPVEFAGKPWRQKLTEVAAELAEDALLVSDPTVLAWLLNLRGGDVPYTPLALGRAILRKSGPRVQVFMDTAKIPAGVMDSFGGVVTFHDPDRLVPALADLAGLRVRVDGAQVPFAVLQALDHAGAKPVKGSDPGVALRAVKNPVELAGMRAAHRRDGAAMVRFLAWLAQQTDTDELRLTDKLEQLRAENQYFQDLSFPTIAGFGPNGAIVHYRSSPATNRVLTQGGLLLLDSGAQYQDGTTDITRTIAIGPSGEEERRRYTQVLRGHMALAQAVFPVGSTGSQLDVLARLPLWVDGVDYDHGTGHGVGSFLSVHEGPQRIAKAGNSVALKPGHVLSNEPGYYKAGHFGIRLENLVTVVTAPAPAGAELALLGFETLTLVPFDTSLIEASLLSPIERIWLNAYHARVQAEITPLLDPATAQWLRQATRAI